MIHENITHKHLHVKDRFKINKITFLFSSSKDQRKTKNTTKIITDNHIIIEAECFDECNELFWGPYFIQNFLILWRQGFFMASGNRTLDAVLRNFFPFFLRYKKIK